MARYANEDLAQIYPLPKSMDAHFEGKYQDKYWLRPKAFPASIVSIDATGTIANVKFEVIEPGTDDGTKDLHPLWPLQFPQMEMPVATDLYGIPPLKAGDKGYCVPADVDLGAVSGYYDNSATLTQPLNLSSLVFHPIGNVKATERTFQDKYFISGPTGAHIKDLSGFADVIIGPVPDGPKNTVQILNLIPASSDADAQQKGVPLGGLYHNNGVVRYQFTVP